ncbi:WD40 repeat-like protein [Coniophora puteana RWD-64-598 SS2]|uniref:WD40 repeat-like protein n=1 Tax=Coniophora puteana (strain RWD-64-598) TaxID=741705 RepID=A0A5M3N1U7_CONPW|nr:WD40 repeat-like protein [Coniophora puteana RWD-64-598 SS2]EIW85359.1 WD40 repeat-like protein [Coniophora puteana RWD-64-598 SS2]
MLGSLQHLQPNPQQQQQQQQQQQNTQQQQQQQQPGSIPPPPPQNGQDFTLSSVLHFLQTEWRRYERDRNEWEIERAEMRARIALLEGERRSFENVKLDLMRRIKMLEYALRMERSKQLSQPASQSVPPSKLAILQAQGSSSQKDEGSHKEGSSGSSPRSEDSPLPPEGRMGNGVAPGRPPSWAGSNWQAGPPGAHGPLGKPPPGRDPKNRARSRDYLKQCLQEISYLTSPQAMNPLPNRPLLNNSSLPLALPNVPAFDQIYNGRPRKMMPEAGKEFPVMNGMNLMSGPSSAPASGQLERSNPLGSMFQNPNGQDGQNNGQGNMPQRPASAQQGQPPPQQQPAPQQPPPQVPSQQQKPMREDDNFEANQTTAIFRPDDKGEWREKLRSSYEQQLNRGFGDERGEQLSGVSSWDRRVREEDEETKEETDLDDDDATAIGEEGAKTWKAKRTFRNHLDAVRALAFHPNELCLATGGDDCTVKIWRMDVSSLTSSAARPTTEVEPQLTLRGHSAAITRLVHSPSKQLLYSASLDSSIRIWALPSPSHTTYAPYDETSHRGELVGHTDAVWDLALVRDESTLISCGAEGMVRVWDVSGPSGGGSLKLRWGYNGLDGTEPESEDAEAPGATAVEAIRADLKKVAVAYTNAVVKVFEIESGRELVKLATDATYDGTSATQVNKIVSHPTMSFLVTAHEDKFIRIFDIITGQCTHAMPAHLDGVTSLSIDAAGFSLVSGSHDCSVRFWDLLGSRTCTQEITTHREKAREGVLDVEFHPSLPFMASAGADGVVKLFSSS